MTIWAILPAAGVGRRMGSSTPKQYLRLNGVPVILLTLQRLAAVNDIEKIIVVVHPDDNNWKTLGLEADQKFKFVSGGEERQHSVLNGLLALGDEATENDWVLVHDAVRPCVEISDIEKLISTLRPHNIGGLLGSTSNNTLKLVNKQQEVVVTIDRSNYWNALTPQMFRYGLLKEAMEKIIEEELVITDEAAAMEFMGHRPQIIEGSKFNIKITREQDLILAGMILDLNNGES